MYFFTNLEPVRCYMSNSNCLFLIYVQISQEAGQVVWHSHLFKNFPVCCDSHKGFDVVNKTEVYVFLEFSCFLCDSVGIGNLISGSSALSKSSLNIWEFSVQNFLTAEDIKNMWQEYTEELYKKDLNDPDNHNGMITHLVPEILECKVKWAFGSIIMNKASGGDGISSELFQILKDDDMNVLHSICQQIWKTQQWPQD